MLLFATPWRKSNSYTITFEYVVFDNIYAGPKLFVIQRIDFIFSKPVIYLFFPCAQTPNTA